MRKIKKALFQENAASVFLFETGIIIITVAVLLIWRSDLFGYFFWQDRSAADIICIGYIWLSLCLDFLRICGAEMKLFSGWQL